MDGDHEHIPEELFQDVKAILAECLDVTEDKVTLAATLRGDLGAESIDLFDIVFRCEMHFGIEVGRGKLFPDLPTPDDSFTVEDLCRYLVKKVALTQ